MLNALKTVSEKTDDIYDDEEYFLNNPNSSKR